MKKYLIYTVLFVLFFSPGSIIAVKRYAFLKSSIPVKGVVVKVELPQNLISDSEGEISQKLYLEYNSPDGRTHSVETFFSDAYSNYAKGQRIDLQIGGQQYEQFVIDTFFDKWFISIWLLGFGFLFFIVSLVFPTIHKYRQSRASWRRSVASRSGRNDG